MKEVSLAFCVDFKTHISTSSKISHLHLKLHIPIVLLTYCSSST